MRAPTIISAVKVPAKPGIKKPAKLLRPIIGLGVSCFVCGVLVSALLVSTFKNRVIDQKVEQLAFTTERIRILESYAGVTPAPLTAAAPQEAEVGPGNALVLASHSAATTLGAAADRSKSAAAPGHATPAQVTAVLTPTAASMTATGGAGGVTPTAKDVRSASPADLPSPRLAPVPGATPPSARSAPSAQLAQARPVPARVNPTPLPAPAAGRPQPPAASEKESITAAMPMPQPRPPVEQPGAAVPGSTDAAAAAATAASEAPSTSVSATTTAGAPALKPSIEAVNRIQTVPAKRAGVDRLESDAVYMLSGKRVGVGEKFDSGETLISVDPDKGKVVTSNRTLVLL